MPPSEIVGLVERAVVKPVMNELVAVVEAEFSAEHAAKLAVERIITKIKKSDPNFHRKETAAANNKVKSRKFKFRGRQSKPTLT